MNPFPTVRFLPMQTITSENFRPFGQVISASPDGNPFAPEDAQLVLDRGVPRFYIMRLHHRGRQFSRITRHHNCTQCLGSLEGQKWFLGVAPPNEEKHPDLEAIAAFRIPGNCFVKLNLGTWHAGPYFDQELVDFYNLELADTNVTDHETCDLESVYGTIFNLT